MQKYQGVVTIIGPPGLIPIVGANVTVLDYASSTEATIYSSNATSATTENPLTTDNSGRYYFYAANGHYTLEESGNALPTRVITDILLQDDQTGDFDNLSISSSLTITASSWAVSPHTTMVAAGTTAAGSQSVFTDNMTAQGHSGGSTDLSFYRMIAKTQGASAISQAIAGRFTLQDSSSGFITTARGVHGEVRIDGSGWVDGAIGVSGAVVLSASGGVSTNIQCLRASSPVITGAGTVAALHGFRASDLSHANITNVMSFYADDHTTTVGCSYAAYFNVASSGTSKWNLYAPGNAPNYMAGRVFLGADRSLQLSNQTNAAGASTATLTNSPAVGNPTFWLKVTVNGTSLLSHFGPDKCLQELEHQ